MARVLVKVRVLPSTAEVNVEELKEKIKNAIKEFAEIYRSSITPIAFGLSALTLEVILEEKEGVMDKLEEAIMSVGNVGSIEVEGVTRI